MEEVADKQSADDAAFWDVMDEEYASVMCLFEGLPSSYTTEQPLAPPTEFWLAEVLDQPLSKDHAYRDPLNAEDAYRKFREGVDRLQAVCEPFSTDTVAAARFQPLLARFRALPLACMQQAAYLICEAAQSYNRPEVRARSHAYYLYYTLITPAAEYLRNAGILDAVKTWFMQLGPAERTTALETLATVPADEQAVVVRVTGLAGLAHQYNPKAFSPVAGVPPAIANVISVYESHMRLRDPNFVPPEQFKNDPLGYARHISSLHRDTAVFGQLIDNI